MAQRIATRPRRQVSSMHTPLIHILSGNVHAGICCCRGKTKVSGPLALPSDLYTILHLAACRRCISSGLRSLNFTFKNVVHPLSCRSFDAALFGTYVRRGAILCFKGRVNPIVDGPGTPNHISGSTQVWDGDGYFCLWGYGFTTSRYRAEGTRTASGRQCRVAGVYFDRY